MKTILSVNNISKTFKLSKKQQKIEKTKEKVRVAANNISFSVKEGEIYGLLGPNGAGKTTSLRIIASLIKADLGEVIVNGYKVSSQAHLVRKQIGFLTSELKLEDFFTPDYLYDYFSSLHNVEKEVSEVRKANLFAQFGIDEFRYVKVADLSTGMKQKVSLVISIVHNPPIIIFDEPTNGLDVITAKGVTDFLEEMKSEGKTIILSTHIFSLVEKLCDRVGIIIDGQMILEDTLSNITKENDLETVFFQLFDESRGN